MDNAQNPYRLFRPGSASFYVLIISCALFVLATPVFIALGGFVFYSDIWPSGADEKGVAYGIGLASLTILLLLVLLIIVLLFTIGGLCVRYVRLCCQCGDEIKQAMEPDYGSISRS